MPPVVRTRGRDRAEAGNDSDDGAAGHPAPERGESDDLSSSLESFGSEPAAVGAAPSTGGKQLHNLRRQQARTMRGVESSATTTNTSTSDEEWSPAGSGGGRKKAQTKKKRGARKGSGGGGKAKKARRAAPADDAEDIIGSDGMLVISRPHDHDVLSGRGGGINAHPGNQIFRDWVLERKESYTLGRDKGDKARVCREVYDLIVSQDPPGRFLMREGGDKMKGRSGGPSLNSASIRGGKSRWVEIPTSRAMAKISQALREGAPSIREAAKKEQKPKASSRGRTPKRKTVSKDSSVNEAAASAGAGRGRKKKKAPTVEEPSRTPKKFESDQKKDGEIKPTVSAKGYSARSRVFPEVKLAPVPAPIVAPEMMMGQYFGSKVAPGKFPSAAVHPQSNQISPTEIMTPDEIAAAEEHFRHGTLVGSPTGHGKEIIMPQPPITMTQPEALRTESDESREHRTDDDLQQAVEAEQQLNHLLQFDKAAAMSSSRPSGAAAAASAPSSSSTLGTPTPQLLPMGPVFSPTFGLGASTSGDHPTMSPPNFATMFDSPIRSESTMHNIAASQDALPPPPFAGAVADGGLLLNRTHSLALSNTASDHGMISSNEVRNVFNDDHDVANSVGSVSGGGVHNHHSSGPNSRAIISPILASQPSSEARDVAPIGTPSRSSSSKNRSSIGRSAHSSSRMSDLSDLPDARLQYHGVDDEPNFYERMREEVYYAAHPEALDPPIGELNRNKKKNRNGVAFSPLKRSRKRKEPSKHNGLITP